MKIERADGITPSEKYLKKLCDRAFLSLWSYSGIYRDQKQGKKGDGKELCDLLVVFEKHIIIFSDKHIEFPDSGDIQLDWSRWYRRAVRDSAKQIFGAERWIKSFPNRLFIDRECIQPFPIEFPDFTKAIFHRIVITHGAAKKCKIYFNGGTGSLFLDNSILGNAHFQGNPQPFVIGQVEPDKGCIHVFDDTTLDIVLSKLDTVTDFVEYLSKKEKFFSTSNFGVIAAGEEDLLAYYYRNLGADGKHDFVLPKENLNFISLEEGFWEDFVQSSQFKTQVEADRVSYSWDALIETFNKNILEDTQHYAYPKGIGSQEKTVRFLAREPRTQRRLLAKSLLELLDITPEDKFALRVVAPLADGDPYFIFMLFPHYEGLAQEEYRKLRRDVLYSYCLVARLKFPDAKDIVGFATDAGTGVRRSEDLIYYDGRDWSDEDKENAENFSNEHGLLKTVREFRTREYEFPVKKSKKRKRHHK